MKKILYHISNEELYQSASVFVHGLAPQRYKYAMRFRQKRDQLNAIMAYVLLCMAYGQSIGELARGVNGKPYLQKSIEQKYFSISHTSTVVAVAISDQDIGIDVEQQSKIDYEVITTVCSLNEQYQIQKDENLATSFWTAKESLSKLRNEDWYSVPVTDLRYNKNRVVDRQNQSVSFEHLKLDRNILCIASEEWDASMFKCISTNNVLNFMKEDVL